MRSIRALLSCARNVGNPGGRGMSRAIVLTLAFGGVVLFSGVTGAETPASRPGLARELFQSCLKAPSQDSVARLASAVRAIPYSEARRRLELKTTTHVYQEPASGRDQRTQTTVTEFRGWDLPGPGAGALEYQAKALETVWIDRSTQQSVTPIRSSLGRSCTLRAPVANARAIFELYEGLTDLPYGIRISADRRWIDVFMFDEDHFDVELSFALGAPLAGVTPDTVQLHEGRLVLPDGGPRFIDADASSVPEGIPTVRLTRASLLAGLDRPATMNFLNEEIEPVVQRLATRGGSPR